VAWPARESGYSRKGDIDRKEEKNVLAKAEDLGARKRSKQGCDLAFRKKIILNGGG